MMHKKNILETQPDLTGWKKSAFLATIVLVSIFSQVDRILPFIMAESIKADLRLSDTQLGLITGLAFALCYSVAALPLARLSDMGRSKQVLAACILVWSAMTGLSGLATSFSMLAFLRVGVALGEAGGTPASHALIVQKIAVSFRGRAIGLFSMGIPLGTMLGFGLGGWANDTIGWRSAFIVAGGLGLVLTALIWLFAGKNQEVMPDLLPTEGFLLASRKLLSKPAFLWLFIAANLVTFASAPFYVFTAPFLIRTHGLTTTEVGLSFGALQGLMGILATLIGGRLFDKLVAGKSGRLLHPPAIVFMIAAVFTSAGLFAPTSSLAIALFVPGMFSFAFCLPFAFGAGHLVAGSGKQAMSSSLLMLATSLLGPSVSPLLVGLISDAFTESNLGNGLQWGLTIGPAASILTALACLMVSRQMGEFWKEKPILT